MNQRTILVTGGTGFIGRAAVAQLIRDGYDVHLLGRTPPEGLEGGTHHLVDLRNPGDLQPLMSRIRPVFLLHFGWVTQPRLYWTSPENLLWGQAPSRSYPLSPLQAANGSWWLAPARNMIGDITRWTNSPP